ncbi:MAG: ATP-binding protein, partial [Pseudomonadales bacterium]
TSSNLIFFRDASERKRSESRNQQSARLEAIGQLTGGVAHDFNNLLQVILAGADEIMQGLDPDNDLYDSANMVLSASLKAGDLTRQLLAFSRQQVLEPKVVSLNTLIHDVDQIIDRALGEQIIVSVTLASDVNVFVDPSQLQSAIVNLAVNARDAMPYGGTLSIQSAIARVNEALAEELACEPGRYVVVIIADNGVGIAAEDIAQVIEPFYTTKPVGQGTGLGLSMVFGFVHQSGGGMHIDSQLGQGTRIELYLPISDAPVQDAPDEPRHSPALVKSAYVLVVEDNELLADMLSRILERAGHRVEIIYNGRAAISRIADNAEIDLLITDVILGTGIDGWSVARACRDVRPDLPIIVMTGFEGSEFREHRNSLDVPILRKPFNRDKVLELMSRLLD